ncbi:glycosyltransferase family 4 protein [Verrucomicrobiota bacterium]
MQDRFFMDMAQTIKEDKRKHPVKVLVVGQIPPPCHGQSVMIQQLLAGKYDKVKLFHVRMGFSSTMQDVGRFQFIKLYRLFRVICSIIYKRFCYNIKILYYPPAGPRKIPTYRDMMILILTRWLFKKTILHFHAGGVSELYSSFSLPLRLLFRLSYFNADAAIRLSEFNPPDPQNLNAKQEFILPNGIPDYFGKNTKKRTDDIPQILFVGTIRRSKGVITLLEAARLLSEQDIEFKLNLVGEPSSLEFEQEVKEKIAAYRLEDSVSMPGLLTGRAKWQAFAQSDIFCYPSFFSAETFGLVLLEAMQFELPVVAARWRGIESVVKNNETGYLIPIKDSRVLAEKIRSLIANPERARIMGRKGRDVYLSLYTADRFRERIEKIFIEVAGKLK